MRRLGIFVFLVSIGCNAILENEPGHLHGSAATSRDGGPSSSETSESDPTEPTEPIAADDNGGGTTKDGGASTEHEDAGSACTLGTKACGDLCVSVVDPFFGCAGASCARCDVPNATAACGPGGACAVGACVAGFADCNATPVDGCETSLQTVNDCGACGLKCPVLKNATMACVAGTCAGTCEPGFGDCNAKPEDGCEKNLLTDKRNCGACGTRCAVGRCEQGVCVWP